MSSSVFVVKIRSFSSVKRICQLVLLLPCELKAYFKNLRHLLKYLGAVMHVAKGQTLFE